MVLTSVANSFVWSRVELAEACRIPNTTPWSSLGASSCCENRKKGTESRTTVAPKASTTGR